MDQIKEYKKEVFEDIKHIDEYGNEYWYARELIKALEYSKWSNFDTVINKAKMACELSEKRFMNILPTSASCRNVPIVLKLK